MVATSIRHWPVEGLLESAFWQNLNGPPSNIDAPFQVHSLTARNAASILTLLLLARDPRSPARAITRQY